MPQHAFALQASGPGRRGARGGAARLDRRRAAADRRAARCSATFGGAFGPEDHDRRMEVLLGNGDTPERGAEPDAWAPPAKRAALRGPARPADRAPPTRRRRLAALDRSTLRDAGPDHRPRELAAQHGPERRRAAAARQPRRASTGRRPMPRRWLDTALTLARGAANDRNWSTAYGIASQGRRPLPGRHRRQRPALWRARRLYEPGLARRHRPPCYRLEPAAPTRRACSISTPAPRARRRPGPRASTGRPAPPAPPASARQANAWLEQAAASPDQFYGQLALERLGRTAAAARDRAAARRGRARRLRAGARSPRRRAISAWSGGAATRRLFVRALAESAGERPRARRRPAEFGRPDRPARSRRLGGARGAQQAARISTTRGAFPEVHDPARLPRTIGRRRTASSARKARSSEAAVSPAGARGMMQLMPGTARDRGAAGRRALQSRPADRGSGL